MVNNIRQKESEKNGIAIENFGIELELINLRWNWN